MLRNAALASSVASMPTRLVSDQTGVGQPLQHPRENRLVRLQVDPPVAFAIPSNGPAPPRAARCPETAAGSTNRPPATRSPVPSPGPRSSRATASGSSGPAPDSAGPRRQRRMSRTGARALNSVRRWLEPETGYTNFDRDNPDGYYRRAKLMAGAVAARADQIDSE